MSFIHTESAYFAVLRFLVSEIRIADRPKQVSNEDKERSKVRNNPESSPLMLASVKKDIPKVFGRVRRPIVSRVES